MSIQNVSMNDEQQAAARSLAVAYNAYNKATQTRPLSMGSSKRDNVGIIVWGENLRIAQQETGIELHGDSLLRQIERARKAQQVVWDAEAAKLAAAKESLKEKEVALSATQLGLALLEQEAENGKEVSRDELREAAYAVADAKHVIAVAKYVQSQGKNHAST